MAKPLPLQGVLSLEALAAQAQSGDRSSLEELAQQVREPLRAFLAKRVPQDVDADDLVQETLMRAFRNLDSYDPGRPFTTWLFTIGKRLAVNHVVAAQRRSSREPASIALAPAHQIEPEPSDIWVRARALLNDESYRALWLRYAQDASIKEVAAELGRTQVSTKVLLYRCRKRLLLELKS
jgi:RNA polymerase sigma-70 factor (ECF subfamily)